MAKGFTTEESADLLECSLWLFARWVFFIWCRRWMGDGFLRFSLSSISLSEGLPLGSAKRQTEILLTTFFSRLDTDSIYHFLSVSQRQFWKMKFSKNLSKMTTRQQSTIVPFWKTCRYFVRTQTWTSSRWSPRWCLAGCHPILSSGMSWSNKWYRHEARRACWWGSRYTCCTRSMFLGHASVVPRDTFDLRQLSPDL